MKLERYKYILKIFLAVNIAFILTAAIMGYRIEQRDRATQSVAGNIDKKVIPVGKTVGIYVNTKGILVIDTSEVTDLYGNVSTPAKNKLIKGDYIVELNGHEVKTKKQLISEITDCGGETLSFVVNRNKEKVEVRVEPVQTGVDTYKIGIWVRDDLQGLGTVTYVKGDEFGALGHCITDTDTGEIMQVMGGKLYLADIYGVEKGISGSPGEIEGMITYDTENVVGDILKNKTYGIFGRVSEGFKNNISGDTPMDIGSEDEVTLGGATLQTYVSGDKKMYDIEIVNIHKNKQGDREMEIKVTDKELIELTGGIVQGMSGSPIIQNGKLIGAVTHVFVNDPKRGYGIFIDKMIG